jgi:ABC-2 type transport system ATP-binding protein
MLYGLTGNRREEKVKALIHLFNLEEHQDVHFDRLSTGMKQRLSLAKSLLNDPAVLFLDEPTVGLDPSVSATIREQIQLIQKQRGMTVLLTTHNMREAEFLCDRIAFLKNGEILTTGTAATLKRMIRMGDSVKIHFKGMIPEDELLRADGVISYGISEGVCEVIVDDGERRLASLLALLSQSGVQIKNVTLGQTDLEDVFLEFASQPSPEEEP